MSGWFLRAMFVLAVSLVGCASHVASVDSVGPLWERPWVDEQGTVRRLADFRGRPIALSMVYRGCQVRCPHTVARLKRLAASRRLDVVLVTLDPVHDTPAKLRSFKDAQGVDSASWHLLRGEPALTAHLARFLSVHPAQDDAHLDHEVRIAMVDARGVVMRRFDDWSFSDEDALSAVGF